MIAGTDGGWAPLVDGGSTIEAPQDAGSSTCTCSFTRPGEPTGGFSVSGITFPCGVALCSASGGHIGCDATGVPTIPDLPACQPMDSCSCEISPGHRLRCDTLLCSGELGNRTAYSCSDKGVLTFPTCR